MAAHTVRHLVNFPTKTEYRIRKIASGDPIGPVILQILESGLMHLKQWRGVSLEEVIRHVVDIPLDVEGKLEFMSYGMRIAGKKTSIEMLIAHIISCETERLSEYASEDRVSELAFAAQLEQPKRSKILDCECRGPCNCG
jgi:hypothetical protein